MSSSVSLHNYPRTGCVQDRVTSKFYRVSYAQRGIPIPPPSIRRPSSFRHLALKHGGINRYSRITVVAIYSAIRGDH